VQHTKENKIMKKIMIALAAIAFTVVSQAASLKWGGAIANGDADTEMSAGSTAWLIWSSTAFTGAATKLDAAAGTADNGGTIVGTYTMTSGDIESYTFTSTYSNVGGDVNGYYAILVADGSDLTKASYMDMGSISGTTATSPESNLFFNLDWDTNAYLSQGGYNTAVVPEPTSGLLILFGMAGLALRRKRA
jgi:ABC-type cobalt transport system substrate-binding protein